MSDGWSICSTLPGAADHAAPPSLDSIWTPIATRNPVAAALRAMKQWSIDDAARNFDVQDWWYRLRFDAPVAPVDGRLVLGLDGLATVAQLWLNGKELLTSDNMFVMHECDVTEELMESGNELLIRFSALDDQLAVRRKRPGWRAPMIQHQQLRWLRTTVLGRTPGWSPPAAVVGPWRDVWLEHRQDVDIKRVALDPEVQSTVGIVRCHVELISLGKSEIDRVELRLECQGQVFVQLLERREGSFAGELKINNVALWWPHTHGTPNLYQATLAVYVVGRPVVDAMALGRLGFRTIALDTNDGGFSLAVNGVPVFCRGACWTPLDPVTLRSSGADCFSAVAQARVAGMNMLRVTGTMVYEEEHFFDACDEQGMLVWQDFMFANMDYPHDDATFMESALLEVRQQLQILKGRACLALLCGNSEVAQQAAMWGAPRELWHPSLFEEEIAQLCREHIPATPYWPSSAYGGSFPHQVDTGTTSYYGVGAYLRNLDDARRSNVKFATECLAFANVPNNTALARMPGGLATRVHHAGWKARSPRDLGAGWDFDDVRDHYLEVIFKIDPQKLRYADHERYLTLSRITTGEVMASSFSEWRRPGSSCQGALVLFMRDLWAGAGWGVVDDAGAPKACYYFLKRVLQPLTLLLTDEGGSGLFVHLINESGVEKDVVLELKVWRGGDVQVAVGRKSLHMPAHSAQSLSSLDLFGHFMDLTYAYRFGPIGCESIVATLRDKNEELVVQTFYFPNGMSHLQEADVGLSARVTIAENTVLLTVSTKRFAQYVHFDLPGFRADQEYFHMEPNSELQVTLEGESSGSLGGTVHAVNSMKSTQVVVFNVNGSA